MKLSKSTWHRTLCTSLQVLAGTVLTTSAALAQSTARADRQPLLDQVLSVVLFGLLGIVLAIIGFKLFDFVVKFDFEREICEKQNIAVALLCGFMVLGICIIIAATVLS